MRNIWFWINLVAFTAYSFIAFYHNLGYLFLGGDGAFVLHMVHHQANWLPFSIGFSANFLEGLGDVFWPINTRLELGYALPLFFFGPDVTSTSFQITSYTLFSLELFVCTFIFARALGVNLAASLLAAWAAPLLIMPYSGYAKLYFFTVLIPHFVTQLSGILLIFAAITHLGRERQGSNSSSLDIVLTFSILFVAMWLCIIQPILALLWIPAIIIGTLGLVFGCQHKREFRIKILGLTVVTLTLLLTGSVAYIYGIFSYSVPYYFPNSLTANTQAWIYNSCWFAHPLGKALIILSVISMLLAILRGNACLRYFALSTFVYMAIIYALGSASMSSTNWPGPFTIYYEAEFWPIYIIFASLLIIKIITFIGKLLPSYMFLRINNSYQIVFLLIYLAVGVTFTLQTPRQERISPLPSINDPIISMLHQEIGQKPGTSFNGRVTTILLSNQKNPITWIDLINLNQPRLEKYNNDFYWAGLWYASLPTLFEYSQAMSPSFFYVARKLAAYEPDKQTRNVIVLRRPDYHNLSLLGVRYVISDQKLMLPFKLIMVDKLDKDDVLYLYELKDTNLGKFSPTQLIASNSLDKSIQLISNKSFNPSISAVVDPSLTDLKLVPAEHVVLTTNKGALHIAASSKGASLLSLPFEFSECLKLLPAKSTAKIQRINGIFIGVIFTGSINIDIIYQTSPLKNSLCRIKDGNWLRAQLTADAKN